MKNIVFVEMQPSIPNAGMYVTMPRHGALQVASYINKAGYNVKYLFEGFINVTLETILSHKPDMVAFTGITSAIPKIKKMAWSLGERGIISVLGGEHASMSTAHFTDYTMPRAGGRELADLLDQVFDTKSERFSDVSIDANLLVGIDNLIVKSQYRLPTQASQGCHLSCSFCVTPYLWNYQCTTRSVSIVTDEIRSGVEKGIRRFMFVDNDFGSNRKHSMMLFERIKDFNANFTALMRVSRASDQKFVKMMANTGFRHVSLGIESRNVDALNEYKKNQSFDEVKRAVYTLNNNGISVMGLFVVGSNKDNIDDVRAIPEYAKEMRIDKIQVMPLTFFPNPLCSNLQKGYDSYKNQIIKGVPLEYLNGHFVTLFPKNMRPSVLQKEIEQAYNEFYSVKMIPTILSKSTPVRSLRSWAGCGFVMKIISRLMHEKRQINGQVMSYIEFLKHKETGRYNLERLQS